MPASGRKKQSEWRSERTRAPNIRAGNELTAQFIWVIERSLNFANAFWAGVTVHSTCIMCRDLVIRPRDNKSRRRYAREFLGCSSCLSPAPPFAPRHLKSRSNCRQIFLKASAEGQQKEERLSEADAACAARRKRNEFFPSLPPPLRAIGPGCGAFSAAPNSGAVDELDVALLLTFFFSRAN